MTSGPSTTPNPARDAASEEADAAQRAAEAKKDRPTRSRKEAEREQRVPLVRNDRKEARKIARQKQREAQDREYAALKSGDERHFPYRDRGPVRRYIRDYVDARWNVGEYVIYVAFGLMLLSMVLISSAPLVSTLALLAVYLLMLITAVDTWLMWRSLKRRLIAKFGESSVARGSGTAWYAIGRAFQIRRSRLPKPLNAKHGVYPE